MTQRSQLASTGIYSSLFDQTIMATGTRTSTSTGAGTSVGISILLTGTNGGGGGGTSTVTLSDLALRRGPGKRDGEHVAPSGPGARLVHAIRYLTGGWS